MRRLLFIVILFLTGSSLMAQSAEDEVVRMKQSMGAEVAQTEQESVEEATPEKDGLPGHMNMSVGTSFSYSKAYGSVMGFYAAPMYTLPLNNRWSLHGGFIVSNYNGLSNNMPGNEFETNNNFNSLAVFAAASYKMTDRLILHGSGLKNLTSYPLSPMAPGLVDNMSMGATYKLGDNITIGASFSINQRQGYYQSSSFGGSSFGGPFSSPFGW